MDPSRPIIPIEEQFRLMADSAPVLIWISGTDKLCYFFNAAWLRFTGRTMAQEYGNGWAEGVHPEDLERCLDIYNSSFDARKEFQMEYRLKCHDGAYRWLLDNGVPRYSAGGTFAGYIGSCVDVDELLESERIKREFIHWEAIEKEQALNEELAASNEELVTINEELQKAHQDLQRLNDELEAKVEARTESLTESEQQAQALNEKLIASNEEMVAINEEMTATNEELRETQEYLQRTLQELSESESRLSMAIAATQLGAWDWNPVSGNLYLSAECNDILGFSPGETIGRETIAGLFYGNDRSRVQQEIQRALADQGGAHYDVSCRIIRADNGELRWVRLQGLAHLDAAGRPMRLVGTLLDITDDKLAEEKSAKLAAIIASSDDAIISKTLDSVITSWNDAAERIFGYTADEVIGETIYKLIPDDRTHEEPEIIARLKRGERLEHFETKRMRKDGRLIDVSVTVSPLFDPQGNIIGLSKIARDITERKLEENRKSDFIGMASHELKTPVTSLAAIIQVANAKLKHSDDPFLASAMDKAHKQVKRMTSMINGFLNVSRLESGKIYIDKQAFNLDELIAETISETVLTVSSHRINFESAGPVQVYADQEKIGSVLSNLLSNAVKYSPKGKVIDVQCRVMDGQAQVSVQDEGMGIKPGDIGHVFDRYYRVNNPHTQHISGFGIGLYLSAEIIHRHDGRIWVESASGVGSAFYFSIPLT
ncbi:PAS domain S-box-containing protein [Mucilaginibacter pineti]|uniref:histidine kinase n=1 Tax=Mucilaginibacter pineti TaxID=1391627 RepID=A0A1G7NV13_9SPHI|nr:PAS domain S-box protein [Mucilaginibacter pineti]SDF77864.1 PAS domain S-box-containing protein [Mucilaginibacter pineti]